jgi:hypothetical protein
MSDAVNNTHPSWCSPRWCRDGGNNVSPYGEHRSEPRGLDLRGVTTDQGVLSREGVGSAYLTRADCPWPTETYLHLETDGIDMALPRSQAAAVIAQLTDLIREDTA